LRHKGELGGVVAFERALEIELDPKLRRCACLEDLHMPGADIIVAVPGIGRALA
jgi:hypothetical protein